MSFFLKRQGFYGFLVFFFDFAQKSNFFLHFSREKFGIDFAYTSSNNIQGDVYESTKSKLSKLQTEKSFY